jgi:hypothetical protein
MHVWIEQYIASLSPAEYQFQLLFLIIVLGYLTYQIWQTHRQYRFMADTATSRIASAAQGYVELKGIGAMIPGAEIRSPFSQRRCLWYQCIVEQRKNIGKSTRWHNISHENSDQIFYLEDQTGCCIILPEGAHIIPSIELHWYGNHLQDKARGALRSGWLARFIGIGRYRFTERLILVADPLYAIGFFRTVQGNTEPEDLQQRVNTLVDGWKQQPLKYLSAFDIDNNGRIQRKEWKLVRAHAKQLILRNRHRQRSEYHTLQQPDQESQPFVISALPEQQILKRKFYRLIVYSVLFLLLFSLLMMALQTGG